MNPMQAPNVGVGGEDHGHRQHDLECRCEQCEVNPWGGFRPGELQVIAAGEGVGKSKLAEWLQEENQ